MNLAQTLLTVWLTLTALLFLALVTVGLWKIRSARRVTSPSPCPDHPKPVGVLVPVKGTFPDQESILSTIAQQDHPSYQVVFIVETADDPATEVVDRLCRRFAHCHTVVSGISTGCAQKNHNLVKGLQRLNLGTEIVVFCDSTNVADPQWLMGLTEPIQTGKCQVVTTFRAFDPQPVTLAGVCQAIYASFVFILTMVSPRPWGGGTAILRKTLLDLNVADAWSRSVVDDLVLGNLLDEAGIPVMSSPGSLLRSPLRDQTISGFLHYLDRQILFPKFTNPGIWAGTLAAIVNLAMAILVSGVTGLICFPTGFAAPFTGFIALAFLAIMAIVVLLLKQTNPHGIPTRNWLTAMPPCLFLAAFVFLRSIFRNYILWHGRVYWPGKAGVVLRQE